MSEGILPVLYLYGAQSSGFSSREILAVILKETIDEYKDYSREEIIGFIEPDSIESDREVSPGRTNSQIQGDTQEFAALNEKVSRFDIRLRAKNVVSCKKG